MAAMIVVVIHATIKISASSFMALLLCLLQVFNEGKNVMTTRKLFPVDPAINGGCMHSAFVFDCVNERHL